MKLAEKIDDSVNILWLKGPICNKKKFKGPIGNKKNLKD